MLNITKVEDLRIFNRRKILKEIYKYGEISRAELSKNLKLNKGTVSTIIKDLQNENLIVEVATGNSVSGRKPIMLSFVNDYCFSININIQIDHAQLTAIDFHHNIIKRNFIPINNKLEFQDFYNLLVKELNIIIESYNNRKLIGISIVSIGSVDLNGNIRLIQDLNWRNIDFKEMLTPIFHVPVHIISIGNLMVSYIRDLNPQYKNIVVLSVDDTITSGTIVNGEVMKGFLGFASTIAHHVINKNETQLCSCGKKGCFAQYCTNGALLNSYNQVSSNKLSSIDSLINCYKENDPLAKTIINDYVDNMAVALGNIIYIINPEIIVVNGTILNTLPQLLHEIYERIALPITYQEIILLTISDDNLMQSASNVSFNYYLDTK